MKCTLSSLYQQTDERYIKDVHHARMHDVESNGKWWYQYIHCITAEYPGTDSHLT